MSKSSALSISVLLIFAMQLFNSELYLKASYFSYALLSRAVIIIFPVTMIYASSKPHKSDLNIDVLNLICLLGLYLFSAVPD